MYGSSENAARRKGAAKRKAGIKQRTGCERCVTIYVWRASKGSCGGLRALVYARPLNGKTSECNLPGRDRDRGLK